MDRVLVLLLLALLSVSCAKVEEEEVFPETSFACQPTAHKTRYLAKKTDGSISKVYANSREELLENYVRPNLDKLVFVEQDQILSIDLPSSRPNNVAASTNTWGPDRIQAQYAWNNGFFGQNITVAVIDSGVEISHSALVNNIKINSIEAAGVAGVDDDQNGFVDDVRGFDFARNKADVIDESGHGTHVAGIISADNAASPHKSIAPQAKVLPLDFMQGGSGFTSDALSAIDYASNNGAQIINASWGSSNCSSILNSRIDSLATENIFFVAAAGNSGNDLARRPEYPAAHKAESLITIGSITSLGFLSSFSNYGIPVDIVAPGSNILSTYKGNQFAYLDGTSMAAPMVSGVAALLLSADPTLTARDLKTKIELSVLGTHYNVRTHGEINVQSAFLFRSL